MPKKDSSTPVNLNAGHRQRLRARFNQCGIAALAPHEIVELLLTYAIPQKDVKPLAKMLLQRFNDLNSLLAAPAELLTAQPGIKENSATLLKLIHALHNHLQENTLKSSDLIGNPGTAIRYLRSRIGYENHEVLAMIILDKANHALGCEWHQGKHNRVDFYPQFIARTILQRNGSGVILAHNHPGGICYPSEADLSTTRTVKNYLDRLELRLVDHLIITRYAHLSLLNRIGCVFKNYSEPVSDPDRVYDKFFDEDN